MTTEASREATTTLVEHLRRNVKEAKNRTRATVKRELQVDLDDDLREMMYYVGALVAAVSHHERKRALSRVAAFLAVPKPQKREIDAAVLSAASALKTASTAAGLTALFDAYQDRRQPGKQLRSSKGQTGGTVASRAEARVLDLPMLDARDVSKFLGSRSTNERQYAARLRRRGALLGLRRGNRYVYPRFQFDETRREVRPVVAEVGKILDAGHDPWGVVSWWMSPNPRLSGQQAPMGLLDSQDADVDLPALAASVAEDVG